MWSWRFAGTRARATQPPSAMDANMCVAVSQSTSVCSMSTVSQDHPARAMKRAAMIEPSDSQVPTDGSPALRARLTGLGRMRQFLLAAPGWGKVSLFYEQGRLMLTNTFLHLPGVGEKKEQKLWADGVHCWGDALLTPSLPAPWRPLLEDSLRHLSDRNPGFFASSLPSNQQWRMFR